MLLFFVTMIRNAVAIMSVDFQVNQRPHECLFHGRRKLHFGRLPHVISFWSQFLSSQLLSESCCPLLLIFSHAWLANYWKTPLNYCQQKRPQFRVVELDRIDLPRLKSKWFFFFIQNWCFLTFSLGAGQKWARLVELYCLLYRQERGKIKQEIARCTHH